MMQETHSYQENITKVRELIKGIHIAVLVTQDEHGHLHSRPMGVQELEFDGDLWFFTDKTSDKVNHINRYPHVNVSFADTGKNTYLSASGTAIVVGDKAKMQELWSPLLKAWFPEGLEDPNITLIKVGIETVEYWDSPDSKVVQLVGFAKAMLTGQPADDLGENKSINLQTGVVNDANK